MIRHSIGIEKVFSNSTKVPVFAITAWFWLTELGGWWWIEPDLARSLVQGALQQVAIRNVISLATVGMGTVCCREGGRTWVEAVQGSGSCACRDLRLECGVVVGHGLHFRSYLSWLDSAVVRGQNPLELGHELSDCTKIQSYTYTASNAKASIKIWNGTVLGWVPTHLA